MDGGYHTLLISKGFVVRYTEVVGNELLTYDTPGCHRRKATYDITDSTSGTVG